MAIFTLHRTVSMLLFSCAGTEDAPWAQYVICKEMMVNDSMKIKLQM